MECRRSKRRQLTLIELDVDGAPPDIVLGSLLVDDALVLGRAASLLAREVDKSAGGGDDGTFVANGILVEKGRRGVALDLDAIHIKASLREVLELLAQEGVVLLALGRLGIVAVEDVGGDVGRLEDHLGLETEGRGGWRRIDDR